MQISNLAIHFNRQVNDGVKLSRQKDMLPILGTITDELDTRIDCQSGSVDGIMRLILGLSPKQIAVYDFTGGGDSSLGDMLKHVFCGRISFYCSFMHK